MQSTGKVAYEHNIKKFITGRLGNEADKRRKNSQFDPSLLDVEEKYVVAFQAAWRSRTARIMVTMTCLIIDCC